MHQTGTLNAKMETKKKLIATAALRIDTWPSYVWFSLICSTLCWSFIMKYQFLTGLGIHRIAGKLMLNKGSITVKQLELVGCCPFQHFFSF